MINPEDDLGFSGESWPQYSEEVERFVALLVSEGVGSYLEVGCRYGDTLHAVGCALPKGSKVVGVDWGKSFVHTGAKKHREDSEFKRGRLKRCVDDLIDSGRNASIIIGDSKATATRNLAARRGPYDAVFIDADHKLSGVDMDWKYYGCLGRLVAFHDVCNDGSRLTGPGQLYRDLAKTMRHELISVDPKRRGIGVLWI